MKNGKIPTRKQIQIMKSHGLNVDCFLVVKSLPDYIEVVKRTDLKKYRDKESQKKIKTKRLSTNI